MKRILSERKFYYFRSEVTLYNGWRPAPNLLRKAFLQQIRDAAVEMLSRPLGAMPTIVASRLRACAVTIGVTTIAVREWQPSLEPA